MRITLAGTPLLAAAQRPPGRTGIHACALVTQAEIEKVLGGKDPMEAMLGNRPPREEELPGGGAWDCSYSTASPFQVDPFPWATLEGDAKAHETRWKPFSGVGDAAYVCNDLCNGTDKGAVGLYARAGQHTITIRIDSGRAPTATPEKARAAAIALAQALIAKLH
jgi:hypothetical protein